MSIEDTSASTGILRGWGCTPTGDPPPAAIPDHNDNKIKPACLPVALRTGWRRTALYTIIVFLMALVFLNIALTLWIIGALKLSMDGVGPIRIVKHGIHIAGQTWAMDRLVASAITSQTAHPITIHSHRNFTVLVSDPSQLEYSKLFIKRDNLECSGRTFDIRDARGHSVFRASRDEVRVFAESLAIDGPGGVVVQGAVQAPLVRAPPGSDLHAVNRDQRCKVWAPRRRFYEEARRLESLTRRMDLKAPQSIYFESRAGNIDIISHGEIKLNSAAGAIKIDASNIHISNLKEASITDKPQKNVWSKKVYQLCVCASGKLFLAAPDALCQSDDNLCR